MTYQRWRAAAHAPARSAGHALTRLGAHATGLGAVSDRRPVGDCPTRPLAVATDQRADTAHVAMARRAPREKHAGRIADRRAVEQRLEMPRCGEDATTLTRVSQREPARIATGVARVAASVHLRGHVVLHWGTLWHLTNCPVRGEHKSPARAAPLRGRDHQTKSPLSACVIARRDHVS